ncbi:hypothetical protein GLOIN_2v523953 [Rhizophagus irregularis DAOM 181602=DAOM 197198]|uniref:Uncharacterized protein n=1 Tax=Rhizophagus irregularis (strain DAOM 181602 / DAOM 197198 / MUCL 43194) TaxID=747089 RepID=A0A2P4PEF3_RHIID|nr:hypothetical protein GLOIN_2v523953 [Rhizophagus irregularis DAOM 181602=DAOM 197198]POG63776.1 hypothetical protein GLOIN_2v523953 [Rhizophagus irregularis DAOM 181602=DAOM 197198]|eukprot:XP_025170642.1 hypothetical protein GLOIN_2v523953 [Rhizophagus irregularis DAOM 181602=DAOM 197198]
MNSIQGAKEYSFYGSLKRNILRKGKTNIIQSSKKFCVFYVLKWLDKEFSLKFYDDVLDKHKCRGLLQIFCLKHFAYISMRSRD